MGCTCVLCGYCQTEQLKEIIMASAKETVTQLTAQLNKAKDEVVAKIEEGTVTAEDLAPLAEVAQALDDLVPDLPEEPVA